MKDICVFCGVDSTSVEIFTKGFTPSEGVCENCLEDIEQFGI